MEELREYVQEFKEWLSGREDFMPSWTSSINWLMYQGLTEREAYEFMAMLDMLIYGAFHPDWASEMELYLEKLGIRLEDLFKEVE